MSFPSTSKMYQSLLRILPEEDAEVARIKKPYVAVKVLKPEFKVALFCEISVLKSGG
jgi:hypothetical protein